MNIAQIIRYENADVLEATWTDDTGAVIKCHAYANSQMAELRADLGADAAQYDSLISEIEATYTPTEPAAAAVPNVISRAQGKTIMIKSGVWELVLQYIAEIQDPLARALAEVAVHDTQEYRRDSPFLNAAAEAIGISGAELDTMFIQGSQIVL